MTEPVISSSATTLYSVDKLTAGSIIRINNEYILVGAVSGSADPYTASSLTRAKYGTTAVGHDSGDAIFEIPKVENPIGIVNGTSTVLIHDSDHGAFSGDYVTFLEIETDPDDTSGVGGITRDTLLTVTGNNETGYYKPTSTQGWEIKKFLTLIIMRLMLAQAGLLMVQQRLMVRFQLPLVKLLLPTVEVLMQMTLSKLMMSTLSLYLNPLILLPIACVVSLDHLKLVIQTMLPCN